MSLSNQTFLFFFKCPKLGNLISFYAQLPYQDQDSNFSLFHRRILKCRELIFSEAEIIATPDNMSKNQIIAIISETRFNSSEFRYKIDKLKLKITKLEYPSPAVFQECLQYSVTAKLAPQWNVVKDMLVQGRDFLTTSGPVRATKMDIFVNDSEVTLCVKPTCIKLPHFKPENYVNLENSFRTSIAINGTCHVMPSLKKGKVLSLSKTNLSTSVFKSYAEIRKHWKNMYGYRLPDIPEEEMWYLSVIFNVPFSSTYTYPYICVRPYGLLEVPRVDPQLTLRSFISDFFKKVGSICREKCEILDIKASFPLLKLYPAGDIKEINAPRIGTTYSTMSNTPYRNNAAENKENINMKNKGRQLSVPETMKPSKISIEGNNPRKFMENLTGKMKTTENNHDTNNLKGNPMYFNLPKSSEQDINAPTNGYVKNFKEKHAENPDNNYDVVQNRQVTSSWTEQVSHVSSEDHTFKFISSNTLLTTLEAKSTFSLETSQKSESQEKYAPKFLPKKRNHIKNLTLPQMFPKIKPKKCVPNFATNKRKLDLNSDTSKTDFPSDTMPFVSKTEMKSLKQERQKSINSPNNVNSISEQKQNSARKPNSRKRKKGEDEAPCDNIKTKNKKKDALLSKKAEKKS